ncbi:MAG: HDOD domain-containing protein [Proteobacteria bacterium]|nr:HDOD domain-containing protein [Pseudomonadota bacterium]
MCSPAAGVKVRLGGEKLQEHRKRNEHGERTCQGYPRPGDAAACLYPDRPTGRRSKELGGGHRQSGQPGSFFHPSAVDTVAKAVSIIGTAQIRNLALSMSVASSFEGLPNDLVSMENFWRHSLLCALSARHLARLIGRCDPDAMFTAGLLHDIGELIIFNRMPEQAKQALMSVLDSGEEIPVHEAERQVMGFDHSDVGGELAREWQLPSLLEECIAHHHDVAGSERYRRETALVHLANILALMAEVDSLDPLDVPPFDPLAWELTGLASDCIEPAVREAQAAILEIEKLFTSKQ